MLAYETWSRRYHVFANHDADLIRRSGDVYETVNACDGKCAANGFAEVYFEVDSKFR